MEESRHDAIQGDVNGFSLIDVSMADDFLLGSPLGGCMVDGAENKLAKGANVHQASEVSDSAKLKKKSSKCNLRKSLAWDSAFFTSEGVLDGDELSSIIEGAGMCMKQKHPLPGIQEDLSISTDSISSFERDSLTLESLEADLFCDIRASIQRSSKATSTGDSATTERPLEESKSVSSLKTLEPSVSMVKPKTAPKKLAASGRGLGKSTRLGPVRSELAKMTVQARESSALPLKAPDVSGRTKQTKTASSNIMPVSASRLKTSSNDAGNANAVAGRVPVAPRTPHPTGSRGMVAKSTAPPRVSGASTVRKTGIPSCRSSSDSSCSSSSESTHKTSTNVTRVRIDGHISLPSTSKSKTPSRAAVKGKSQALNSRLSAHVQSGKLSSSISPASSISEWSTESSSSTTTVTHKPNSLENCSTSCENVKADKGVPVYLQGHPRNLPSTKHENKAAGKLQQPTKYASTASGSTSRPASVKPSGLRMPSPKIGFFDGVKMGNRTPSGAVLSRSGIPSNLRRSETGGCSPTGSENKAKLKNIVPAVTRKVVGNTNPSAEQINTRTKPVEEKSIVSQVFAAGNIDNYSDLSVDTQKRLPPRSGGENLIKAADGAKDDTDSSFEGKGSYQTDVQRTMSSEVKSWLTHEQVTDVVDVRINNVDANGNNKLCSESSYHVLENTPSYDTDVDNVNPCRKVCEIAMATGDNLDFVNVNGSKNMVESARRDVTDENQYYEHSTDSDKQNAYVEDKVDLIDNKVETRSENMETREDFKGDSVSKNVVILDDDDTSCKVLVSSSDFSIHELNEGGTHVNPKRDCTFCNKKSYQVLENNPSDITNGSNVYPDEQVCETLAMGKGVNLDILNVNGYMHLSESVQHGTINEKQGEWHSAVNDKKNEYGEDKMDDMNNYVDARDQTTEAQEELKGDFLSHVDVLKSFTRSSASICTETTLDTRTPLALKNASSDIIGGGGNNSAGSTVEKLVKRFTTLSLQTPLKENS